MRAASETCESEVAVEATRSKGWAVNLRDILLALSLLIIGIGIYRVFGLALHQPLLGYANNTDMVRMQACVQIWPASNGIKAGGATFAAPISDYKFESHDDLNRLCLPASELLFIYPGKFLAQLFHLQTIPIQLFGLIRALALSAIAVLFGLFLVRRKAVGAAPAHAVAWAVVVADPANTLYLNTFYTEFAALFFAYTSFVLLWVVLAYGETKVRASWLAVSVFLLGASRHQHMLLPAALAIVVCAAHLTALKRVKWTMWALVAASVASLVFYVRYEQIFPNTQNYMYYINYANATDVYLGAVLSAADDPAQAAAGLGLPARCADAAGKTWYTAEVQKDHPCPEVRAVSRARLARVILRGPGILYRMIRGGVPLLRPWIVSLGQVEGQEFGSADRLVFTLATWIDRVPAGGPGLMFVAALLAAALVIPANRASRARPVFALIGALGVACVEVFLSALFGDGYFEFQKHAHLFFSFWCSLLLVTGTAVVVLIGSECAYTARRCVRRWRASYASGRGGD